MIGIFRAHFGRSPIPPGDELGACGHMNAVIEAEVAISWLMPRQSGVSNGVVMLKSPLSRASGAFPLCRKMFYSTTQSAAEAECEKRNDRGDTSGI